MVCDFCQENEAIIFLEQYSQGERRKLNICLECAMARGIEPDSKNIESHVKDLFTELTERVKKTLSENNKACPVCATRLGEIKNNQIVGCPECYEIFKDSIRNQLNKNGIKIRYSGEMPSRLSSVHSVLTDRIALQNKMNEAIEKEEYEKAAMYRDYLKALEKKAVNFVEE